MFELLATYAPMMRWTPNATPSTVSSDGQMMGNYGNMTGRHLALFNNMMGAERDWSVWLWIVLCLVTWVLVNLVLLALFRWLWKKGGK